MIYSERKWLYVNYISLKLRGEEKGKKKIKKEEIAFYFFTKKHEHKTNCISNLLILLHVEKNVNLTEPLHVLGELTPKHYHLNLKV